MYYLLMILSLYMEFSDISGWHSDISGYHRYNGLSLDLLGGCIEYAPLAHAVKVLVHVRHIVTLGSSQMLYAL